jgi:hypothetical protein
MLKNAFVFFEKIKKAIENRDANKLKDINNKCSLELALFQEKYLFYTSLIAYCLSKIITKPRYGNLSQLLKRVMKFLDVASSEARAENARGVENALENALFEISKLEQVDKRFIHDIIEKGRTKIAALLYAEGVSLDTAVSLTGAQRYEVLNYSGKTMMADRFGKTLSVRERMKKARELFG